MADWQRYPISGQSFNYDPEAMRGELESLARFLNAPRDTEQAFMGALQPGAPSPLAAVREQGGVLELLASVVPGIGEGMDFEDIREGYQTGNYGQMGLGALSAALPFVTGLGGMVKAYHGSPHKFDVFDASKIGSGEGAQAFGHGLYFAEDPKIAGHYRDVLTSRGSFSVDGEVLNEVTTAHWLPALEAAERGELEKFVGAMDARIRELGEDAPLELLDVADAAESLIGKQVERASGALYDVELDVEPEDLLDWDLPLKEQPEKVQVAAYEHVERLLDDPNAILMEKALDEIEAGTWTGEQIYKMFARGGDQAGASESLRQAGIPGLRYFDAGSRPGQQGTRNVVIFPGEEGRIKITGRQ